MKSKTKNKIILFFILSLALPFLMLKSFYPFFRMGMYAEVQQPKQEIDFKIFLVNNKKEPFDYSKTRIPDHYLAQLSRNYYYRNDITTFVERLELIKKRNGLEGYIQFEVSEKGKTKSYRLEK